MNDTELIHRLRQKIREAGSLRKWCMANGFSFAFISFVLNGKSKMTPRLAAALGFEEVKYWVEGS